MKNDRLRAFYDYVKKKYPNFIELSYVNESFLYELFELEQLSSKETTKLIIKEGKNDKIMVTKFKSKIRYRKRVGHRQPYSLVKIEKV